MLVKGTFEFELSDGSKKYFKFGTLASEIFCEEEGITSFSQMQERLTNPGPKTAINVALASAKAYYESKNQEIDFNRGDVSDWLDEIGVEKFFEKIYASMSVYKDKFDKEVVKNA
jgi:hypothetical protein